MIKYDAIDLVCNVLDEFVLQFFVIAKLSTRTLYFHIFHQLRYFSLNLAFFAYNNQDLTVLAYLLVIIVYSFSPFTGVAGHI